MSEISCIETHIEMLMEPEELVRIGADKGDGRELQLRVLRIFSAFNELQAENKWLRTAIETARDWFRQPECGIEWEDAAEFMQSALDRKYPTLPERN